MIVTITGSRNSMSAQDKEFVFGVLNRLQVSIYAMFVGDATGIDDLASEWALELQRTCYKYYANWHKYDRAAGPIRNKIMLDAAKKYADGCQRDVVLLAFPGGSGTRNCMKQAKEMNIQVLRIDR